MGCTGRGAPLWMPINVSRRLPLPFSPRAGAFCAPAALGGGDTRHRLPFCLHRRLPLRPGRPCHPFRRPGPRTPSAPAPREAMVASSLRCACRPYRGTPRPSLPSPCWCWRQWPNSRRGTGLCARRWIGAEGWPEGGKRGGHAAPSGGHQTAAGVQGCARSGGQAQGDGLKGDGVKGMPAPSGSHQTAAGVQGCARSGRQVQRDGLKGDGAKGTPPRTRECAPQGSPMKGNATNLPAHFPTHIGYQQKQGGDDRRIRILF